MRGQGEAKFCSGYAQEKAGRARPGLSLQDLGKRGVPGQDKNVVVIVVTR
jgi:hypothetical protein